MQVKALQDKLFTQADERLGKLLSRISTAPIHVGEEWFQRLLTILVTSLRTNLNLLRHEALDIVTLGSRNILELQFMIEYVLSSNERAHSFERDLIIDAAELYEALDKTWTQVVQDNLDSFRAMLPNAKPEHRDWILAQIQEEEATAQRPSAFSADADAFRQLMVTKGITGRPKTVHAMAESLGKKDRFAPWFKVSSKVLHPTALSIAADANSLNAVAQLIYVSGTGHASIASDLVEKYLDSNGVCSPKV